MTPSRDPPPGPSRDPSRDPPSRDPPSRDPPPDNDIPPGYCDISYVCAATGVSRSTVTRAAHTPADEGGLPGYADATGRILFKEKDANAWIAKRLRLIPVTPKPKEDDR